jgi:DNA-binding NarL/FixJ family response regulator
MGGIRRHHSNVATEFSDCITLAEQRPARGYEERPVAGYESAAVAFHQAGPIFFPGMADMGLPSINCVTPRRQRPAFVNWRTAAPRLPFARAQQARNCMTIAQSLPPLPPAATQVLISGEPSVRRYLLTSRPRHRIRVAVLDDHPVIALGMASFLQHQADFEVVHTETSAVKFLESLKQSPCDVVIVDFYLPRQPWEGIHFIKRIRRLHPELVIITFSAGKIMDTEYAAFKAGANGYVPKGERLPFLADMIRLAINTPRAFYSCGDGQVQDCRPKRPEERLTNAELEILRNIALGLSVTQIASKLLRSKKTISTHKRRAMKKLELADDLALALYLKEKFEQSIGD